MSTQCPRSTPWGRADHVEQIVPGIWWVSTPSHGGFYVAPERWATMPEYMKSTPYSRGGWFEEDVDWCLPVVVFETEFREKPSQFVREDAHLEAFKYEYHSERRAQWEGGAR